MKMNIYKLVASAAIITCALIWGNSILSAAQSGVNAQNGVKNYAEGEVLVKYRDTATSARMDALRSKVGARMLRKFDHINVHHLQISPGQSVEQAIKDLMSDPDVEYAEPNYIRHALWTPDDYNALQPTQKWGMEAISAPAAWDMVNSCTPTVAVIDSGISSHPDLDAHLVKGWNAITGTSDTTDGLNHGSLVGGIIGAIGNNVSGISGICATGAKVMPLKFIGSTGSGYVSDEIKAIRYAEYNGVKIINLSIGSSYCSLSEYDAIARYNTQGGLAIVASGNDGLDNDGADTSYPASYGLPNIISVAASTSTDSLASFSNFGYNSVDLAAPGSNIYSTNNQDYYEAKNGTSFATPHVTGIAALIKTAFPEMTNTEIRAQMLGTVDVVPALEGKVATGGRLNAYAAIANRVPAGPTMLPAFVNAATNTVDLTWTDTSTDETEFRIERMLLSESRFSVTNTLLADTTFSAEPMPAEGAYYRVMAINTTMPGITLRSEPSIIIGVNGALTSDLYTAPICTPPPPLPSSGGGGSGCFIATAAYGTTMAPELGTLRSFRDNTLMGHTAGRAIVNFYYRNSPPLAAAISHSPAMKAVVRTALSPVVMTVRHPLAALSMAFALACMLITWSRRKFIKEERVK